MYRNEPDEVRDLHKELGHLGRIAKRATNPGDQRRAGERINEIVDRLVQLKDLRPNEADRYRQI